MKTTKRKSCACEQSDKWWKPQIENNESKAEMCVSRLELKSLLMHYTWSPHTLLPHLRTHMLVIVFLKANSIPRPFCFLSDPRGTRELGRRCLQAEWVYCMCIHVCVYIYTVRRLLSYVSVRDYRLRCRATLTSLLCPARERSSQVVLGSLHILGNW